MPWEDYSKELEHPSCDLKHTGAGPGGANSAAAFIEKFIDDDVACAPPTDLSEVARVLLTGTVVVRRDPLRHRRRQRHPGLAAGRERLGRADGAGLGAGEPRRGVSGAGRVVFLGGIKRGLVRGCTLRASSANAKRRVYPQCFPASGPAARGSRGSYR